ncbi:hypothetical protein BLOT_001860 [Blomia tropicalis]|nr:hypothetical protein BLOT_001860 [Blomia tropicalis]
MISAGISKYSNLISEVLADIRPFVILYEKASSVEDGVSSDSLQLSMRMNSHCFYYKMELVNQQFQTHNLATCNQTKNLQIHLNQVYPLLFKPSIETNKRRTSNKPRTRIRRAALKMCRCNILFSSIRLLEV